MPSICIVDGTLSIAKNGNGNFVHFMFKKLMEIKDAM
jgi:hypothetical protein